MDGTSKPESARKSVDHGSDGDFDFAHVTPPSNTSPVSLAIPVVIPNHFDAVELPTSTPTPATSATATALTQNTTAIVPTTTATTVITKPETIGTTTTQNVDEELEELPEDFSDIPRSKYEEAFQSPPPSPERHGLELVWIQFELIWLKFLFGLYQ